MHNKCFNWFNEHKQIIENNILTQRRLIDKNKRDFWLKWRRNFLKKKTNNKNFLWLTKNFYLLKKYKC